jgi:hypothetical protein
MADVPFPPEWTRRIFSDSGAQMVQTTPSGL